MISIAIVDSGDAMGDPEVRAYEEIIDFIAASSGPRSVIAFRPSEATRARAKIN